METNLTTPGDEFVVLYSSLTKQKKKETRGKKEKKMDVVVTHME